MQKKRILITGGAGFVGSNLVDYLLEETDHSVMVLDNFSMGRRESLQNLPIEVVEGDINDYKLVDELAARCDGIVHLAAKTRVIDSIKDPDLYFDTNVAATYNLLRCAQRHKVGGFVFASTGGAIVGEVPPPVNEDCTPRPVSPYGATKMAGEAFCYAFSGAYGLPAVSLRFSNVYGPRSLLKESVVAQFMKTVLDGKVLTVYGDGSQTRDFIYVRDMVAVITRCLESPPPNSCYQLGSGRPTSVNELLDLMREVIGDRHRIDVEYLDFRQGEIRHTYADITRARTDMGFAPNTPLKNGLAETWAWISEHHHLLRG